VKLAVFSGQYFWFDGKHYSTDEAFVKFVTSFCPYFEKIVFCDAVKEETRTQAYILDPTKTEICALPYFSVYSFWRNILVIFPKIYRVVVDNIHHWDVVWLPLPHPVSLLFAYVCRRERRPFFLIVRQNLMEQVRHRNKGIKRFLAIAAVAILDYLSKKLAEKNLTFTVGKEMYDAYNRKGKEVYQIAVSLVSERDIEDTARSKSFELHRPVRLLSVGRLDPEKGIHFLIEALDQLIKENRLEVVLQIVGKGLKDGEDRKLYRDVETRQLTRYISFLDYVAHGQELLDLYRQSDVFVLPSLTGEGIPQTLFEAMACGVPVIATRVAGIPNVIVDRVDGLLINPGSPREISDAVELLVIHSKLRNHIVKNGLETARKHTLETERDQMFGCIARALRQTGIEQRL
jgi:glycosyltransferase involved in cell wall biosynthesis